MIICIFSSKSITFKIQSPLRFSELCQYICSLRLAESCGLRTYFSLIFIFFSINTRFLFLFLFSANMSREPSETEFRQQIWNEVSFLFFYVLSLRLFGDICSVVTNIVCSVWMLSSGRSEKLNSDKRISFSPLQIATFCR